MKTQKVFEVWNDLTNKRVESKDYNKKALDILLGSEPNYEWFLTDVMAEMAIHSITTPGVYYIRPMYYVSLHGI